MYYLWGVNILFHLLLFVMMFIELGVDVCKLERPPTRPATERQSAGTRRKSGTSLRNVRLSIIFYRVQLHLTITFLLTSSVQARKLTQQNRGLIRLWSSCWASYMPTLFIWRFESQHLISIELFNYAVCVLYDLIVCSAVLVNETLHWFNVIWLFN